MDTWFHILTHCIKQGNTISQSVNKANDRSKILKISQDSVHPQYKYTRTKLKKQNINWTCPPEIPISIRGLNRISGGALHLMQMSYDMIHETWGYSKHSYTWCLLETSGSIFIFHNQATMTHSRSQLTQVSNTTVPITSDKSGAIEYSSGINIQQ